MITCHKPGGATTGETSDTRVLPVHRQEVAVLVHGPPQILSSPVERHEDFIQIPGVAQLASSAPQRSCVVEAERLTPLADGFVRHRDALRPQLDSALHTQTGGSGCRPRAPRGATHAGSHRRYWPTELSRATRSCACRTPHRAPAAAARTPGGRVRSAPRWSRCAAVTGVRDAHGTGSPSQRSTGPNWRTVGSARRSCGGRTRPGLPPCLCRCPSPAARSDRHDAISEAQAEAVSRPGELHPQPLVERYVNLSTHTAPIGRTHRSSRCGMPKDCVFIRISSWKVQLDTDKTTRRRPFAPSPLQRLPHYYERLRPSASHRYSGSCGVTT